jgi:hypothetical protein
VNTRLLAVAVPPPIIGVDMLRFQRSLPVVRFTASNVPVGFS